VLYGTCASGRDLAPAEVRWAGLVADPARGTWVRAFGSQPTRFWVSKWPKGFPASDTLHGFGAPMRYLQTACGAPPANRTLTPYHHVRPGRRVGVSPPAVTGRVQWRR
jgi:hypothetical protein